MNNLNYQVLNELEMDLKFLNNHLMNQFNTKEILDKEDVSELFQNNEIDTKSNEKIDVVHML